MADYTRAVANIAASGNSTVYTPSNDTLMTSLRIANDGSADTTVLVELVNGGVDYTIQRDTTVPVTTGFECLRRPMALISGDSIKVTNGSGADISVIISVAEGVS